MLLSRLLLLVMKHFGVCFDKEFVFRVVELPSTHPVRKKYAHIGIEAPNKNVCQNARLQNIKQLVVPYGYIQVIHNESVTVCRLNFF